MTAVVDLDKIVEPPFSGLDWHAGKGLHVVLTGAEAGGDLLVELVAGMRRPRRGRVRVAGTDPSSSPRTRRRIASLLGREQLIAADTAQRALQWELAVRGARLDTAALLSEWGLDRLKASKPAALEPSECRALGLAVALSLPDPVLVALVEPFADHTGLSRERIRHRLISLAETTCVLCTTVVPRDAVELGGRVYLVRSGVLEPVTLPVTEPLAGLFGYLIVSCERPRDLVEALAGESAVAGLEWRDHAGDRVLVWGSTAEELALAVVRASRAASCGLRSMIPARASLELVRAAQSGWARALHERAEWRARSIADPAGLSSPPGEKSA